MEGMGDRGEILRLAFIPKTLRVGVFRNFSSQTGFKLRGFNTIQLAPISSDYVRVALHSTYLIS